jgi:hypothetical protein
LKIYIIIENQNIVTAVTLSMAPRRKVSRTKVPLAARGVEASASVEAISSSSQQPERPSEHIR